jgi:septal ring factor EnvC (AmiA/AmiB activator)
LATPAPLIPPAAPTIPLTDETKAAYQELYTKLEAAIVATADDDVLRGLNASQQAVDDTLTQDTAYRLHADTAQFAALLKQINSTNDGLKTLKDQIAALATHLAQGAAVIAAINKVLTLIPGA